MKQLLVLLFVFVLTTISPYALAAETSPSPEELVSLYYQKMGEKDMSSLASYMHKDELVKFKKMMLPVFEATLTSPGASDALTPFSHGDTIEQIQDYSPEKFLARFLQWIMAMKPGMDEVLKHSTIKPIGHISEETPDGEVIHVVFRMTSSVEGVTITKLSVMSLRQDGETWKLLLTGDIEGIAQSLQRQIQQRGPTR